MIARNAMVTSGNPSPESNSPVTFDYSDTFAAGAGTLTVTGGSDSDGDGNVTGDGSVVPTNLPGGAAQRAARPGSTSLGM